MSTIEVTCRCGKVFHAPAAYAGKRGRCKRCGATVDIPDESTNFDPPDDDPGLPVVVDDDDHPARRVYQKSAPPAAPPPAVVVERKQPEEPWYYWFLDAYARWVMGLGLSACALGVFIGIMTIVGASGDSVAPAVSSGLGSIALSLVAVVPVLMASTPIFLAVDAARNLRAMRYKAEE